MKDLGDDSSLTLEGIRKIRRRKSQGKRLPENWLSAIERTLNMKRNFFERNRILRTYLEIREIELHLKFLVGGLSYSEEFANERDVFILQEERARRNG